MTTDGDFWQPDPDGYQHRTYGGPEPTPEVVEAVEAKLGYTLPGSYVALLRTRNGGFPVNDRHPATSTTWAPDHVAVTGFFGIGPKLLAAQEDALDGGYPPLGVYIADCPTAGHDLIALDYRDCGPSGGPAVVHIDQKSDFQVTHLASNFASFVAQLRPGSDYDGLPGQHRAEARERIWTAQFSPLLNSLLVFYPDRSLAPKLRGLASVILAEKGCFALHDDPLSHLMYDTQFLLASFRFRLTTPNAYLLMYDTMLANVDKDHFGTRGYSPRFVEAWLASCLRTDRLEHATAGLRFTGEAEIEVLTKLERYRIP